jgi:hypothetical protein
MRRKTSELFGIFIQAFVWNLRCNQAVSLACRRSFERDIRIFFITEVSRPTMKTASKKPSSAPSVSKREARRKAQRRNRTITQVIQWVAIIGVLAGLVVLVVLITTNGQAGSGEQIEGLQIFPNPDRGHTTEPVTYAQNPPVGGPHHPSWQNCGVYTQPVPNENAVHSLEHGVVWITYQPDLAAEDLQRLQELTRQSGYRLLSPYPSLPSPIVLSAWGYQLQVEQSDDPRIEDFIRAFEQNPRGPEPGAPCTGGVGIPS